MAKNLACGSKAGTAEMVNHERKSDWFYYQGITGGSVQMCCIDDDINVEWEVGFLKVNVQGKEEAVLKGAQEAILRWKPLIALSRCIPCTSVLEQSFANAQVYLTQMGAVKWQETKNFVYYLFPLACH